MASFTITLLPAGWTFAADAHTPLLRAAEQAGIDLPSSCRNGTCRTCICRVAAMPPGGVRHLVDWPGLSRDELGDGYILPCVALACADLALEQRLARRRAGQD